MTKEIEKISDELVMRKDDGLAHDYSAHHMKVRDFIDKTLIMLTPQQCVTLLACKLKMQEAKYYNELKD